MKKDYTPFAILLGIIIIIIPVALTVVFYSWAEQSRLTPPIPFGLACTFIAISVLCSFCITYPAGDNVKGLAISIIHLDKDIEFKLMSIPNPNQPNEDVKSPIFYYLAYNAQECYYMVSGIQYTNGTYKKNVVGEIIAVTAETKA